MTPNRAAIIEANLDRALADAGSRPLPASIGPDEPITTETTLTAAAARDLFEDMVRSRVLDVVARELKARDQGYYTISSAGHEANAILGAILRPTDPGFLHYRSGGLMMARARQAGLGEQPLRDTLLSLCASGDDPISGGRHKVWGSRALWVPPQTSTIASHLPKAVGTAFALRHAQRVGGGGELPSDAIVACSFGDASANHATALAGITAARYSHRRGGPVPILFVCEDNGIGISVDTPAGWIEDSFAHLPGLTYVRAEGQIDQVWATVHAAVEHCRTARAPVFLHLPVVRLLGHAGSDVETAYRRLDAIEADEARDPLVSAARRLIEVGAATPDQLAEVVTATRTRVRALAVEAADTPKLASRAEVMAPLTRADRDAVVADARAGAQVDPVVRAQVFGREMPEHATAPTRRTLAAHINAALRDELARRPEALLFGEDVARKGGVYHVTAGLLDAFGPARVFDTLLDETTILGVAQGAGLLGLLPISEIQYLAYLHNALDQIRGEAASLAFFSNGRFTNPMVVRVASFGYQKGFGGHFHNDNAIGALRDIPGLLIAAPSRGDDAARMLRGCVATAQVDGRVVVFLEPIALYHEKDLHAPGDGGWLTDYPEPGEVLLPGEVGIHHPDATDVLIVSYANGLRLSLRAAKRLADGYGIRARVLDVRWLNPLPVAAIRRHADACNAVLVADECRATGGGIADAVIADLAEAGYRCPLASVRSADSYVPLGPAADLVLLSEDDIVAGARALLD